MAKLHPIIFTGRMVRALLNGSKTQTRRVLYGKTGWMVPLASVSPGDQLYVREGLTYANDALRYKADGAPVDVTQAPDGFVCRQASVSGMFMPRWAARLILNVEAVWTERLQDMTKADAVAEGVTRRMVERAVRELDDPIPESPWIGGYAWLWNSLHPRQSWHSNPEVVAIRFNAESALYLRQRRTNVGSANREGAPQK